MARTKPQPAPLVMWRDGIHIRATPIWCDARRARDVCFVSCAHSIGKERHGQLIATADTLALLGDQQTGTRLSVPFGRPFTLGTVRLELIRSGHTLGSAGLLVDVGGQRVLHAGAISVRDVGLGGVADSRPCDAVVLAATYGDPRYRFPGPREVLAGVRRFAQEVVAAGGMAVLLVSSPSKALDVASRLAGTGQESSLALAAHRSIHDAARALRPMHPTLPQLRRFSGRAAAQVLLWPMQQRAALPVQLPAGSRTALVAGSALDPDVVAGLAADAAFPWSNQADHRELVGYVDACGAHRVYLTGAGAEPLARALARPGRTVQVLGPPQQMRLF